MDPREFLQLAATMASMVNAGPARYRTSISRSYYAAFLVALSFIKRAGLEPLGGPHKHSAIKNGLLFSANDAAKKLGIALDTLHEQRNWADYEMSNAKPEQQALAQAAAAQATAIINGLDGILGTAGFQALAASIKKWATATAGSGLRVV